MNNVILYSPCCFTALTIRNVASQYYYSQYNIVHLSEFSNLLTHINSIECNNKILIIVDLNSKSAHWKANYLCAFWHLRRMAIHNKKIKKISFLALGTSKQKPPFFLQDISLLRDVNQLMSTMIHFFDSEDNYLLKPIKNDIEMKAFLIYALTKGLNTIQIAIVLNVSEKSVRNKLEALMREIGLRKSYEFALFSGNVYKYIHEH